MHARMYVCMYGWMDGWMYVCMYIDTQTHTHTLGHTLCIAVSFATMHQGLPTVLRNIPNSMTGGRYLNLGVSQTLAPQY